MGNSALNLNQRAVFETDLNKWANISFCKKTHYDYRSLKTRVAEFREGYRGARDKVRTQAYELADSLNNSVSHQFSFYLYVHESGRLGTKAPQDVISEAVTNLGCKCGVRQLQRNDKLLVALGLITIHSTATGTIKDIGQRRCTSLKVNEVRLTSLGQLLTLDRPPVSTQKTPKKSITTFCDPLVGNNKRETHKGSLSLSNREVTIEDKSSHARRASGESEEFAKAHKCTRPAAKPQTVKQRASRNASRKAASKAAAVPSSARRSRNKAPSTWDFCRKRLLADLFVNLKEIPGAADMHRLAAVQTDRHYPAAYKNVVDWNFWVWRWVDEMTWHERRRACLKVIIPALQAHCAYLFPHVPDKDALQDEKTAAIAEAQQKYESLAEWMQVLPSPISMAVPARIRTNLESNRFRIDALARAIHTGKIQLTDLTEEEHFLLRDAATAAGHT